MQNTPWLPLDIAAKQFGYAYKESLSRRLRQLRQQGQVIDKGRPPAAYGQIQADVNAPITLLWPNPQTALLRNDAPRALLHAQRGRPAAA